MERLSIAWVINTNTHWELVSRLGFRRCSHADFEDANQHSAQLNKSFHWRHPRFRSLDKRVVQSPPAETRRRYFHQVIQRPVDLLNRGAWLLLKLARYERLHSVV